MKNFLKIIFLIVSFSIFSLAQTPASTPIPYFDKVYQTYDKFDDSTTTEVEFRIIKNTTGPGDSLRLNLKSKFSGKKSSLNTSPILLTMVSFDTESFSSSSKLIFLFDDERLRPNFVNHTIKRFDSIDSLIEYTSFNISLEDLKKLAFSKKNEARIDLTEFSIKDESLRLIQDFYNKIFP